MPRIDDTTDRQSSFLRAFRLHHGGPPPEAWPSPAILRRWLRHDGFRRAYADLQRTLKSALAFQSLTTGLAATRSLHADLADPAPLRTIPADPAAARAQLQRERLRHRADLAFLRLAHARLTKPPRAAARRPKPQSEPAPQPAPDPYANETLEEAAVRLAHPNCRPEVAIAFIKGEPHPFYDDPDDDIDKRLPDATAAGDPTECSNSDGINRIL